MKIAVSVKKRAVETEKNMISLVDETKVMTAAMLNVERSLSWNSLATDAGQSQDSETSEKTGERYRKQSE